MNSSISASEPALRPWRRVLRRYVVSALILWASIWILLLALDPYDSGHFALFRAHGVPRFGQRLRDASLARAPEVNAAIIGNSTIQLIDPARLGPARGLHAVSLAIPGTGPIEQLAVARWLLRHHPGTQLRALVFGIDATWCQSDGQLLLPNPFPFWLYGANRLDYAVNMMRLQSLDAAGRKVKLLLGLDKPFRADGYDDYDTDGAWNPAPLAIPIDDSVTNGAGANFAAMPLLARFLDDLSATTTVVLLFPPRYHTALPVPGSPAAQNYAACKAGFGAIAAARPRTTVIDFAHDGAIAERDENFRDPIHYRSPVAREVEDEIDAAFGETGQAARAP